MVGPRMPARFLRPWLAGPLLGALALAGLLVLWQRPAPLLVNLGAGDDAFARGFREWERDGLRGSGETMFRWTLDGALVELPLRVVSGSLTARLRLARFTDRPADITAARSESSGAPRHLPARRVSSPAAGGRAPRFRS